MCSLTLVIEIKIVSCTLPEVPGNARPGIWMREVAETKYSDWKWVTVEDIEKLPAKTSGDRGGG